MERKGANKVELYDSTNKRTEIFEINHAERILRAPNNGGWVLPEDSPYQFNRINGLTIRANTRSTTKAQE